MELNSIDGDQDRMTLDLVQRFITRELLPLEPEALQRMARNEPALLPEQEARLRSVCKEVDCGASTHLSTSEARISPSRPC